MLVFRENKENDTSKRKMTINDYNDYRSHCFLVNTDHVLKIARISLYFPIRFANSIFGSVDRLSLVIWRSINTALIYLGSVNLTSVNLNRSKRLNVNTALGPTALAITLFFFCTNFNVTRYR